ncbi:hypothetical protein AQJ84_27015 [Streptomyces resistomycificus]|uniref:Uncharacterized protein n=1 Tax=Streptomyces resistomycificus TaxID=67356 RepID=A0A0L8KSR2_9ACTN|nr:hypothetical protein ADK37_38310 [Streptomyces resistomycificus]KUN94337.1 hypothetical protein AQJ84_27015 [Streptomyces resistomycificus]
MPAGGHSAIHISAIISVPATAATGSADTRATRARAIPSNPNMNCHFAHGSPAQEWKVDSSGHDGTPGRAGELLTARGTSSR